MAKKRLLLLLSATAFAAFICFSYLVAKEHFTKLDFNTTVKFQDRIPDKAISPSLILTFIGSIEFSSIVWIFLIIMSLLKKWWLVAVFLLLFPAGLVIEIYGKTFVHHPSPPRFLLKGVIPIDLPKYYITEQFAYPSGHMFRTTFLATFLLGVGLARRVFRNQIFMIVIFIFFVVSMGVTRIFLGEHWLSDVVGGTLLGLSFGLFTWLVIPTKKVAG